MAEVSREEWQEFYNRFPEAHMLQSAAWGSLKAEFGWDVSWVAAGDAGAQVLFRRLPLGFTVAYIPKGPLGEAGVGFWEAVRAACKARRAVFLKVEPDAWEGAGPDLSEFGFQPSAHSIQPRRTVTVDITGEEDEILGRMKQKTRYNVRLAGRKEVVVRPSADVSEFSQMMDITGARDAFGVHTEAYYQRAYDLFYPAGMCELLIAEYEEEPLAGLMAFGRGERAWYLYGASTNQHRNRMPTYAIQWEAIRWAREKGCTSYDLWGVPDVDQEALEAQFAERHDGLWGVYRFKRGFGGTLMRSAQPWDMVFKPILYKVYQMRMGADG